MIEVYVRHADKCPKRDEGANYKRCKCPKWLYGDIPGKGPRSRISAKTRSWEKAEQAARKLEEGKSLPEVRKEEARVTIAAAVHEYLQSAQDCGISDDTLLKKTRTFKVTRREEQKVTQSHHPQALPFPTRLVERTRLQIHRRTRHQRSDTVALYMEDGGACKA